MSDHEPPPLTPRAIERNVLPAMDLLERADTLIAYMPDDDPAVVRWRLDYEKLLRSER